MSHIRFLSAIVFLPGIFLSLFVLSACAPGPETSTVTFASALPDPDFAGRAVKFSSNSLLPTPTSTFATAMSSPEPSPTRTPFPAPRVSLSDNLGITAEYGYGASDIDVSATSGAFVWAWQDWSNEKQTEIYPGLFFVPAYNLLETRHLDANQPVVLAVESLQERVVTGSSDGAIEIWNARTGMRDFVFGTVPGKPTGIALNADDSLVAVGASGRYQGGDGSVTIWRKEDSKPRVVLPAYGAVTRVAFVPGSNTLYFSTGAGSCSRGGGGVFAWDGQAVEAKEVFSASGNPVPDFAIHPQGKILAAVGQTGAARCLGTSAVTIFDGASGKVLRVLPQTQNLSDSPPMADAMSVGFSPDGKYLAVGDFAGNLHIWEWETGKLVTTLELSSSPIAGVRWTSQNMLLLDDDDGYVRFFRAPVP